MSKKKENKEVDFELTPYERQRLQGIGDTREAIAELQRALLPLAKQIAVDQRVWWDMVLDDRGLSRDDGQYSINGNVIVLKEKEATK